MGVTAGEAVGRGPNDHWLVLSHHRVPNRLCVSRPRALLTPHPPTDSLPLVVGSPLGPDCITSNFSTGSDRGARDAGGVRSHSQHTRIDAELLVGESSVPSAGDRGTRLHT